MMKNTVRVLASIAILFGTAQAGQPVEIELQASDLRAEPDGERLGSIAVTLPSSLRGRRIDFATLELWIEPSTEDADTIPFLVSAVPLGEDEGSTVEVPGRWASVVVASPRVPKRIVLDATRVLRYWMENPRVDRILTVKVSQRQLPENPSISTSRLGGGMVARLRVYSTRLSGARSVADVR